MQNVICYKRLVEDVTSPHSDQKSFSPLAEPCGAQVNKRVLQVPVSEKTGCVVVAQVHRTLELNERYK